MNKREPKWQQQVKAAIDAMNNDDLFAHLLGVTQESGDDEMQSGIKWANRIAFEADYAQQVFAKRLLNAGILTKAQ